MSVLNRVPRGFLDLMGSISQGRNPPQYVDAVSPIVDVRALYLGSVLGVCAIDAAHTARGQSFPMVQGDNELWLLRGLSCRVLAYTAANNYEKWEVGLQRPVLEAENNAVAGAAPLIWTSDTLAPGANFVDGDSDSIVFDEPIVLQPGVGLVWHIIQRDNLPNRTTELRAMVEILQA